jgi:hypothetical protein
MALGDKMILFVVFLVFLLVLAAWTAPRLKKYQLVLRKTGTKKRRAKAGKKKSKSKAIVIKLI